MKKLFILSLLFAFVATPLLSQTTFQNAINDRLNLYFQATKEKRWNDLIELIYPKLFEKVTKEEMITLFEDMEGNGIQLNMEDFNATRISDVMQHEAEQFALVDYNAKMIIQFTSQADKAPEMVEIFRNSFNNTYGEENVIYHAENNSFELSVKKSMFAIADAEKNNWTFIESDATQNAMLGELIPKAVLQHFF